MTHEYTILVGGAVIPGGDEAASDGAPGCSAIAWADDTVLAIGSDAEVLAISRGDSRVHDVGGAVVRPLNEGSRLEPGGPADLLLLAPGTLTRVAVIRGGRVVEGALPGNWHREGAHDHDGEGPTRP